MAKPIKETPILTGNDAAGFLLKMKTNKDKKVSKQDVNSIKESYSKIRKLIKS